MKPSEVKLRFHAADLAKTQKFYSVLGVLWLGGEPEEIGSSGRPVSAERVPTPSGLPDLWGNLGNLEVLFYLDNGNHFSERANRTVIMIYYDEHDAISKIVESLAALHLFARDKGFAKRQGGTIYDPDGRAIEICGPHPYRL